MSKKRISTKVLDVIERVGNKLPDPFVLFVILSGIVMLVSFIAEKLNASVEHPGSGEELPVNNLLSSDGLRFILEETITNFTEFTPLGIVIIIMLGIGLANKVGLLDYAIQKTILKAPPFLLTYMVVFVGIMGNLAGDAAFVIIPPLTALVFHKAKRNPMAGLIGGFAGAGAGFTANLFIGGVDLNLSGVSTEAARMIDDSFSVTPVDNWFFSVISVIVLTIVGGLVTRFITEPRLGTYEGQYESEEVQYSNRSKYGLILVTILSVIYWGGLFTWLLLPNSPLRGEGGSITESPFMDGIVPILFLYFFLIGLTYGITTGSIQSTKDMTEKMSEAIKEMSSFIVLVFAISQFISYFDWTNLGTYLAVNGGELLEKVEFTGFGMIITYVVFTALMNLVITSGIAKWALEAPIFIPMFMQLGYHPAFTQVAYRIADSSFNIVTPLFPSMIIVLQFMRQYDKNTNIGSYMALTLPYTLAFFIAWVILLTIFYLFNLPFGPGVYSHLN